MEKALLIRSPLIVDDPKLVFDRFAKLGEADNLLSFNSLMQRALRLHGVKPDQDQELISSRVTEFSFLSFKPVQKAWRLNGPPYKLEDAPFRLLAMVRRPDLARFGCPDGASEGHRVCGHELRFIFGAVDDRGPLDTLLILEFVLETSKSAFKKDLNRLVNGLPKFSQLASALKVSLPAELGTATGVRLRLSSKTSDGSWDLRQYQITPAAGKPAAIEEVALDREIRIGGGWQGTEQCSLSGEATAFVRDDSSKIVRGLYQLPAKLSTIRGIMPGTRLWLPEGTSTGTESLSATRFALGLNTCVGCHVEETGVSFVHVDNRQNGQQSKLSGFLTGRKVADDKDSPSLDYRTVSIPGKLGGCFDGSEKHSFNDLLRRHLYIRRVLELDPGLTNWTAKMDDLTTYESH